MKQISRLDRCIAAILTVAFLGFIGLALGSMLIKNGSDIYDSARLMRKIEPYLPENWGILDLLNGRIQSFSAQIKESMFLKDELGYINSGFQYGLGKRMITTGGQNMVTLNSGRLYDLMEYKDLSSGADNILAMTEGIPEGTSFTFVYEHPSVYDPADLPAGYDVLDAAPEMADEITTLLRESGIDVMDSRDILPDCGIEMDRLLMATDQHWTTLAALVMAQNIADHIGLDSSLISLDQMNTQLHEALYLGRYGQRVGTAFIHPDDIIEYWPKYDTHISRHTLKTTNEEDASGDFRTAVIRADRLETEPGKTWNTTAYTDYGLTDAYDHYINDDIADTTVILFKDSYACPIGAFLSLTAHEVIAVDLRKDSKTAQEWIDEYQPDHIVMAYSLQMLRDDEYKFE